MNPLRDLAITTGLRVFVRANLDVSLDANGAIVDTFRLDTMLPTLNYLVQAGAFPVIAGHMGRPQGVYVEKLSTKVLKPYFEDKLGVGNFELLENLRFDPREKKNVLGYAKELSKKADVYVNECFAVCHRKHASVVGIPQFLSAYGGLRLEEEIATLAGVFTNSKRPLIAIVGGAKLDTKGPAVFKFLEVCDLVLVGGKISRELQKESNDKLKLAVDFAHGGLDIGPQTVKMFTEFIGSVSSIIWAGPLGLCEEGYTEGTKGVAEAVIDSGAFSVVGGGDTVTALKNLDVLNGFSFVSTGGGAMLEFLVEGNLPALEVLGYNA